MTADEFQKEATNIRPKLAAEARRYLSSSDEAEDVVQDALLRLWDMRWKLRIPMAPLASATVRHLCVDRLRKSPQTTAIENIRLSDDNNGNHEGVEHMMKIVATLPETQQTILRMRHIEGLDMASIATLTGKSEAAIRQVLSRARRAVREKYMKTYKA